MDINKEMSLYYETSKNETVDACHRGGKMDRLSGWLTVNGSKQLIFICGSKMVMSGWVYPQHLFVHFIEF